MIIHDSFLMFVYVCCLLIGQDALPLMLYRGEASTDQDIPADAHRSEMAPWRRQEDPLRYMCECDIITVTYIYII